MRAKLIRTSLLAMTVVTAGVLGACGSVLPATYSADDLPELSTLDETWGCGWGFWAGTADQTVALRFSYNGESEPDTEIELPDPEWSATLIEGTDLYANWCDDVIEENEPTPVEHWSLPITGGTLTIDGAIPAPFEGGQLSVHATDLVVELPDGTTAPLGSTTITNQSWGFFAG